MKAISEEAAHRNGAPPLFWLPGEDSNLQPPDPESGALPIKLPGSPKARLTMLRNRSRFRQNGWLSYSFSQVGGAGGKELCAPRFREQHRPKKLYAGNRRDAYVKPYRMVVMSP